MSDSSSFSRKMAVFAAAGLFALAAPRLFRQRMDLNGKSVVITGGSRGLGLEMARAFAAEGARVTIIARDQEELDSARGMLEEGSADVITISCDIRDRNEVTDAVSSIIHQRGRIDVLVNNAGVIQVGPVENLTMEDFETGMGVHAWGPLYLMNEVIPYMKQQGDGRIVNISSIAGLIAVPHLLAYVMSKFALVGLSDGMRSELARYGIKVTTVCPGLMRTGSPVNALFTGQHEKEYAWFAISDAMPLLTINSARAARQIVEAARTGAPRLIITLPAKLGYLANALFPNLTALILKTAAGLLPDPVPMGEHQLYTGWESRSKTPDWMTYLNDKGIPRNNEGPPHS